MVDGTPLPPDPAYQQVLKGLPAVDYTRDELLYLPRNPRSWRVYGFSPVEQVVMTVNIALRRQLHQLEYYTEGSVPEALIGVPETWTPDQIGQFQAYWDALLEGDTAQRRHARFVPATISKSFVQTKDAALKDEYDEWLARIICYAFAVAPGSLTRDNNRATADFQHSQALQEGLLPLMRWVKALVDRSIADHFGWPDLEFAWKQDRDIDPLTQAQINQIYLAAGVLTPDEVRAEIGKGDAAAKRQAGGVALGKDWQTQGRQGEGAQNPGWFGNGTGGSTSVVPVSHAATYGAAGAVIGGAAAAVGSVVLDGLSGGVNAPLTPAEVAAGAAVGGVIGHEVGRLMDQWSNQSSETGQDATQESGEGAEEEGAGSKPPDSDYPSVPKDPNDLLKQGYVEDTHPKALQKGTRTFKNPQTGDELEFHKGQPGEAGYKGRDHYHRKNPNSTSKRDWYLDDGGNPVPDQSKKSHIEP